MTHPYPDDESLFSAAAERPVTERAAFLDGACAGDPARRARVEALLRSLDAGQEFMMTANAAVQTAISPDEKPGDVIGRYKLLQNIGEGGCGVVWMAEQEQPVRRRVALKVIKLGMDTKMVIARFEAERQALAMMDHPNIAKIFDAGTTDTGRPFFVMELVRGVPITKFCDEGSLSTDARLKLFIQVCHAIQHAHQKGIIHRDIKPSNILVTLHDDVAVPKVIDFGIAKATQGRLTDATVFTAFEQFIGTPAYMSPEQAEYNGLDVDTRSDVYSLGVLLYELLTGRPPFDPKTLVASGLDQIRKIIREVDPPRPSMRLDTLAAAERTTLAKLRGLAPAQLATLIKGDLDWIVMKSLEKNRTRRYESASAFATDVQRHLGHEAVTARPPSRSYLLGRLVRRHRLAFAAGAAIAAALVLGFGFSTWSFIKEKAARQRAVVAEQEQTKQREHADAARLRAVAAEAEQSKAREQAELARADEARQRVEAEAARERAVAAESEQSRLRGVESELRTRAEAQTLATRRQAYASDIHRVQQALTNDNFLLAQQLLDRGRPKPGELDLRGWEWRFLWQFCQSESTSVLTPLTDAQSAFPPMVGSISVSSDGAWLAAAQDNPRAARLWNLRTRQATTVPLPEVGRTFTLAFAPHGTLLAMVCPGNSSATRPVPGRIRLWDAATREIVSEWETHANVGQIAFAADGRTVLTSGGLTSYPKHAEIRRIPDGGLVQALPELVPVGISPGYVGMIVSSDLRLAVHHLHHKFADSPVAGRRGLLEFGPESLWPSIRVVELASGRELWHAAPPGIGNVTRFAFSADAKIVAAAQQRRQPISNLWGVSDAIVALWEVETGRQIGLLEGHRDAVTATIFWPDGKTMATGSLDQTIRIWDTATQRLVRVLHGHTHGVTKLALLPDNRTLVSSSIDGTVRFWDTTVPQPTAHFEIKPALRRPHESWRFSPDGRSVVAADVNETLQQLSGSDFSERRQLITKRLLPNSAGNNLLFAHDAPLIAHTSQAGAVQIWNWERGSLEREFQPFPGLARPLAFRDRGTKVLFNLEGDDAGQRGLHEWDVATGEKSRFWPRSESVGQYRVSADGKWCLVKLTSSVAGTGPAEVNRSGFSMIDLVTGAERKLPDLPLFGSAWSFSPDGRLFAAATGSTVSVWETQDFHLVNQLTGSGLAASNVTFSPDGRRLLVAIGGETFRFWDTEGWEHLLTLTVPIPRLNSAAFSPDGNLIGAMNFDGQLRLWRAPTWAEIEAAERVKQSLPPTKPATAPK